MQELKEKLRQAQQNFNYADPNYIDAAIMDLNAAEEKLNIYMKEAKVSESNIGGKGNKRVEKIAFRLQKRNW